MPTHPLDQLTLIYTISLAFFDHFAPNNLLLTFSKISKISKVAWERVLKWVDWSRSGPSFSLHFVDCVNIQVSFEFLLFLKEMDNSSLEKRLISLVVSWSSINVITLCTGHNYWLYSDLSWLINEGLLVSGFTTCLCS